MKEDRGRLNPIEAFRNACGVNSIVQLDSRKPVRTSFRSQYPVPLPVEVVELARFLKSKSNIYVNERLEKVVRKEVIKMAQEYNRHLQETEEKQAKGVDSQPRP